jgi:hypothetical protein
VMLDRPRSRPCTPNQTSLSPRASPAMRATSPALAPPCPASREVGPTAPAPRATPQGAAAASPDASPANQSASNVVTGCGRTRSRAPRGVIPRPKSPRPQRHPHPPRAPARRRSTQAPDGRALWKMACESDGPIRQFSRNVGPAARSSVLSTTGGTNNPRHQPKTRRGVLFDAFNS